MNATLTPEERVTDPFDFIANIAKMKVFGSASWTLVELAIDKASERDNPLIPLTQGCLPSS
ncbi:hypothetical protein PV371_34920 [Streptomyces sp. TX20-6-3]|uniref:hypothetical protein n=1 Tax=Streptomyces sp. TX20-6-3 TaxID=3028705 RepID=UPI0029AAAB72|nr:hypothetical protein [Streptomyces sp. TX20-6-3]MDX2564818.1 hypothetical protein [Streptomyces sp. TX20-6-3]